MFSGVFKVVKKIAPFALAAATAFFTLGGSLAVGGVSLAGGWAGAVGSAIGGLGLGGTTLGGILGGAVTYAGYGALAGAAIGLATGQNVGEAALAGAGAGALAGGIGAGLGLINPTGAAAAGGAAESGLTYGSPYGGPGPGGAVAGAGAPVAGAGVGSGVAAGTAAAGGGFLERNAAWLGPILGNVGSALIAGSDEDEEDPRYKQKMPQVWYPAKRRAKAAAKKETTADVAQAETPVPGSALPEQVSPRTVKARNSVVARMNA